LPSSKCDFTRSWPICHSSNVLALISAHIRLGIGAYEGKESGLLVWQRCVQKMTDLPAPPKSQCEEKIGCILSSVCLAWLRCVMHTFGTGSSIHLGQIYWSPLHALVNLLGNTWPSSLPRLLHPVQHCTQTSHDSQYGWAMQGARQFGHFRNKACGCNDSLHFINNGLRQLQYNNLIWCQKEMTIVLHVWTV
jgi:hypothetical protein